MRQRTSQWFSLGLVLHLYEVDDGAVLRAYEACGSKTRDAQISSTRSDRGLVAMLTMLAPHEFQTIASYYPPGSQVTWQKLQVECAAASTANLAQGPFTVYNQTTCGEFNKFLVATLIGYERSLKRCRRQRQFSEFPPFCGA